MDTEARARELVLFAQNNLADLWRRADGDFAGSVAEPFSPPDSEVVQLRRDFVQASGHWTAAAMEVFSEGKPGPYVDHLGSWYNTIVLQRQKLVVGGWAGDLAIDTFVKTFPEEVAKQADILGSTAAKALAVVVVIIIADRLMR